MKNSKYQCDLKTCFMCKNCLPEWLEAIGANRQTYQVKKNEVILQEGDPVTGIYFVYEGNFKVHKKWGDKELIIRFAQQGAIIGHRGLGSETSVYPISATALENGSVCFIPLEFFMAGLKVNQDFLLKFMLFFADELQDSEQKMRNLAHMPVKGRVAQSLLTLKAMYGLTADGFIGLDLARQDLAAFSGATYETVFRIVNELVAEKLIQLRGKSIKIISEAGLLQLTHYFVAEPAG